jgi:2-C-methyl-D-erythritol 4-phosphate cytidylyltransferase
MISALITAAGSSTRFGKNKMLAPICGRPLLLRTVQRFLACEDIAQIIVTARETDRPHYETLLGDFPIVSVVRGGNERVESLLNAIRASSGDILITHDGARPLVRPGLIRKLIACVRETGAAMTAVNPTATVKLTQGDSLEITDTLPRASTWIAQTPQGFRRDIILRAAEKAVREGYFIPTDDSEIVAVMTAHPVTIVPGDHSNIKVTYRPDVAIANQLFEPC